jgi:hypothetical protein
MNVDRNPACIWIRSKDLGVDFGELSRAAKRRRQPPGQNDGMSDRSTTSRLRVSALVIAGMITFAAVVEGVSILVRAVSAPEIEAENAVNTDPTMTWDRFQKVSEGQAGQIAFKEVKQREGWSGTITAAVLGEFGWVVTVGHKPDASHDYRVVGVDAKTGAVGDYRTVTPKKP